MVDKFGFMECFGVYYIIIGIGNIDRKWVKFNVIGICKD